MADLASHQHGVFDRVQATAAGLSTDAIRQRLAAGRWTQPRPGVFAIAGTPVTWEQRVMSACLHAGPSAVAARRTAARLWALPGQVGAQIQTVTAGNRRPSPGVRAHLTATLPARDVTTRTGIPVTSACRTLIDCAADVPLHRLGEMLDDARRRRLVSLGQVARRLDELGVPGRNGVAAMREALADRDTPPASVFESRLAALLSSAGLPTSVRNHRVVVAGKTFVLDFAFVTERVCVEADGEAFHLDLAAFQRDRTRQNALVLAGWTVVRFTWRDVSRRPVDVVRAVAAALELGRSRR